MTYTVNEDYLRVVSVLKMASRAYYVFDDPILTDAEYDRYFRRAREIEEQYPSLIDPTSPTQVVGPSRDQRPYEPLEQRENLSCSKSFEEYKERE